MDPDNPETTEPDVNLDTREGYDLWALNYDDYDNALIALEEPIVKGLIGPVDGLKVADIGCGTGRYSLRLAEAGAEVVGVDFSTGMLDVLRRKTASRSLKIYEYDLTKGIPFESNAFDRVICCLVIEHIPDIDRMFFELARICKPGGQVIVTDFHPEMIRRGYHARFRVAPGGAKHQISGAYHPVSSYVMAVVRSGLIIKHISEHIMDDKTVAHSKSAKKWVGFPLLLVLKLAKESSSEQDKRL